MRALKALRDWQETRLKSGPYQVPTYEEFCVIVQAIEEDAAGREKAALGIQHSDSTEEQNE